MIGMQLWSRFRKIGNKKFEQEKNKLKESILIFYKGLNYGSVCTNSEE